MWGENRPGITRKIVYCLSAVLVFALLAVLTFPNKAKESERTEYPVVILGDSLMGLCRDETSVTEFLGERLGKPVFNGAFGGTCMAVVSQGPSDNYTSELLNMVSLSKAIAADDFGVQKTIRSKQAVTEHFGDTIDELECIDFQKVEILILNFGLNDYHTGIPIDNAGNPMDETTYAGALRSVLATLKQTYPDMRIVLATPTYTWYLSNNLTCEEYVIGEACLEEYVETEISVAEEFGVEVIDLYHGLYVHGNWEDWQTYTIDGLHPNEYSREMIAGILAETIERENS